METVRENKMGVMPMKKLVLAVSLPIMASMLVQAMYNIVDSIFVARFSEDALTAVGMAFPLQTLMIAVSVGTGVGINSLISRRLGEKRQEDANKAAANGMFLAAISWVVFAILGLTIVRPFFESYNPGAAVVEYGVTYTTICMVVSLGVFEAVAAERIMQATGKTIYHMLTQGTGAVVNIILDPILIFGIEGVIPAMGVAGAAWAAVAGQIVAMILGTILNHVKNPYIQVRFKGFKPDPHIIKEIYRVGVPAIVMQGLTAVMTMFFNYILAMFSTTAITVYGVYYKLQSFVLMPVIGLGNGAVSIIGYNFGARSRTRIVSCIKVAITYGFVLMMAGLLIFQLWPAQMIGLFDPSPGLLEIGVPAIRTISLSFVLAAGCIVLISAFQAVGSGLCSLMMSLIRQILIIVPVAYLLAITLGLDALWWSYPIAEVVCLIIGVILWRRTYVKKVKPLDVPPDGAALA